MTIFLQLPRSLAKPHSSVSVQFVTDLMSSSHRARGVPLFLVNIIDFSKLFSLRMICPKYDSCCFFINASSGLVALISSITDVLVQDTRYEKLYLTSVCIQKRSSCCLWYL